MKKTILGLLGVMVVLSILVAACGTSPTPETVTVVQTVE